MGCTFPRTVVFTFVLCIWLSPLVVNSHDSGQYEYEIFSANVRINYTDPISGKNVHRHISGRFGVSSPVEMGPEFGRAIHVETADNANHACDPVVNAPKSGHWIALIQRGNCKFETKVKAAWKKNASAVVIYNHVHEDTLITMDHSVADIVSVFIHKKDGDELAKLVDDNILVTMNISVGDVLTTLTFNENGTLSLSHMPTVKNLNLLIISLTFVLLLIIGLTCVLVYAVKRSKYMQAKNRARDMIFTVDMSNEAKEARVRLLNSHANPNATLSSVQEVPIPSQPQPTNLDQPVV